MKMAKSFPLHIAIYSKGVVVSNNDGNNNIGRLALVKTLFKFKQSS
jgi:hypothetical protein